MEKLPSLKDLTREQLEELYRALYVESLNLEEEIEKLTFVASSAVEEMKKSRRADEDDQRLIDELIKYIQTRFDKNFSLDDIPKYLN